MLVRERIYRRVDSSPTSMVEAFKKLAKGAAMVAHELVLAQKEISGLQAKTCCKGGHNSRTCKTPVEKFSWTVLCAVILGIYKVYANDLKIGAMTP